MTATGPRTPPHQGAVGDPAARRMAAAARALDASALPAAVVAKAKLCLRDLIGCACESRELPWAVQARGLATPVTGGASIIGHAGGASAGDAAFANAVMGHGLVREDMHPGSISHLGIVVLPSVLALAEKAPATGAELIAAIVVGYEIGGQLGRAVMDASVARIHRPTGVTGPVAGAAAGARLRGLDEDAFTSALALAANTSAGFNQWAWTGGSEMFFQAGSAARNAVTAVELAAAGAFGSPSAIEGRAGLCTALGKPDAGDRMQPFAGTHEILCVYHKAVPACNFAQTPALAALQIVREAAPEPARIAAITVRVPQAGASYPGCDASGPWANVLQGKMSIQFNVAAALARGEITERNFTGLDDADIARLVALTTLEVDDALSAAYPELQGGEVVITLDDGARHGVRLDDVVHATDTEVESRFRAAVTETFGAARAQAIDAAIDALDTLPDAGALARLLRK
ncbi:MAG: MmgE/PrpD family protein [Gammaproteobacteria bacterium]